MNVNFRYAFLPAFFLSFFLCGVPAFAQVYDHGDPTAEEQYELELINRARANPHAEGDLLFSTTDPYLVNNRTFWLQQKQQNPQIFAEDASQVRSDFYGYAAVPPLAFNKDLIAAARSHSQDMLANNYQAHTSPFDATNTFDKRINDAGYSGYTAIGENIFAYGNDLDEINQEFEYDFNNPGTGHRVNLINFTGPVYTEIGIGILHGTGSGGYNAAHQQSDVGPLITTEDFGNAKTFITGVVYGDDNHNNFYDVGEGMAGVTITASNGWSAVSSTSGGYAIPFSGAGNITVRASGGPLTSEISHTVAVGTDNVKVDFIQGSTGFPDKPILIAPIADTTINNDTAHFSWMGSGGEKKYMIVVATDAKMTKIILKDSSLTIPSRIFPKVSGEKVLLDGTTYYWQVKSRNVIGWGQFSPVDSFSVALPPKQVVVISPADKFNTGTNDISLNWHNTTPEASDFWVEISSSPTFVTDLKSDTLYPGPDTVIKYPAADFEPQHTYYWRVRAQNDNGWSLPSVVRSFTTGGVNEVASTSNSELQVSVSPNPASGAARINFSLGTAAEVSLRIFDLSGAEETNVNLGTLSPDNYEFYWNCRSLPAGVYHYELIAGNQSETGKIVVVR